MQENYIYVLHCNGIVKVGKSYNPAKRINTHRSSNPFIEEVVVYKAPEWGEKYIHNKLASHLVKGCTEWFNFYPEIYEDIAKYIQEVRIKENEVTEEVDKTVKLFTLKDPNREDYAKVAARNLPRALKMMAYNSPIRAEFVSEEVISDQSNQEEYVLTSRIRTNQEVMYCRANNIKFNDLGITERRFKNYMLSDNYTVPEVLWNKGMKAVYTKPAKKFKGSSRGRNKKKFVKNCQ